VIVAALSWPQASVYIALIVTIGLVVAVLICSIFRTGQTAIRSERRAALAADERKRVDA
jgi:hypothetical protein